MSSPIDPALRNQAAYDRIARAYAESNDGALPADLEHLAVMLIDRLGSSGRVVDLGCGTGRDMSWFERRGVEATGVDRSAGMLSYARQASRGLHITADLRALPFKPASFEAAWCIASLLHLSRCEAPAALTEIRRVLKPQAPFALSMQEGEGERWEAGYETDIERLFTRYQQQELESMLGAAGFCIIESGRTPLPNRTWLTFLSVAR